MSRCGPLRFTPIKTVPRCLLAACLAALILAAPAGASSTQESIIQDDPLLLGAKNQAEVTQIFRAFSAIGVDRVRVSLFWNHVAPANRSQRRRGFRGPGSWWPGSYPEGSWESYDRIVIGAAQAGVELLFTVTGPAPAWATPGRHRKEGAFRPSPAQFRNFVTAAAIRYSGAYPLFPVRAPSRNRLVIGGIPIGPGEPAPPRFIPYRLPRVTHWSIWNEPNYPTWLFPVWLPNRPRTPADMVANSPHHYRRLVQAAYRGFTATGHGRSTILIGETAPRGGKKPSQLGNAMPPAEFARELYCLRRDFRAYSGEDARRRNCPASAGARARFRAANPGLFRANGWAVHPYSLDRNTWRLPPWRHPIRDNVPIGNLGHMIRTVDRAQRRWGGGRRFSFWITEYGYQTRPPDPTAGVAPRRQGRLTAWGEYLAFRNPRVASIAQFLLFDAGPVAGESGRRRWISWQSGLFTRRGQLKPFALDYQIPLHVQQRGRSARVFSALRPAPNGVPLVAQVQYAAGGSPPFTRLADVGVGNARNYLSTTVQVPEAGLVRVSWFDPRTGYVLPSSPVAVR